MVSNLIKLVKQPLIVALVIGFISIPKIGNTILSILSSREKLAPYSTIILLILKSVFGASMFYGINSNV